ncbi:hypothetical protein FGG08_006478 [Glutinoglossum americanum]|uniref:Uncharacterized protein n=1 Tax=Glutinoglossum americanum TaxID=1670608 RepID=A0A9P8L1V1_9PEZI|nr:hypothetical protein FGG08_006478 [Glutinoglossum americanum]
MKVLVEEWVDYRQQALANCEFLCGGKNVSIITRECDGMFEALAVKLVRGDDGCMVEQSTVRFQSSKMHHVGDAIKDLHRKTAESVGRIFPRPTQPAEETLSDPRYESDWSQVQRTPTESEDPRESVSRKVSTECTPPEPKAADEGRSISAEEFAPCGNLVLSPSEDITVEKEQLGLVSVEETKTKEGGRCPSANIGEGDAAVNQTAEDEWSFQPTGKMKKGKKGKKGKVSSPS